MKLNTPPRLSNITTQFTCKEQTNTSYIKLDSAIRTNILEFSLKVFTEFSDNFFSKNKKRLLYSNPGPLPKRQRWYHIATKTHVRERIIKLTLIHASVILSVSLNSLNSVKIGSIQGKPHLCRLRIKKRIWTITQRYSTILLVLVGQICQFFMAYRC